MSFKQYYKRFMMGVSFCLTLSVALPVVYAQDLAENTIVVEGAELEVQDANIFLKDVLQQTYETHPDILGARADLKSTIENVSIALANYRPDIRLSGEATTQITEPSTFGSPGNEQQNIVLDIEQPLYRGGRTTAAVKAAEYRIGAGRSGFIALTQDIFFDVIEAMTNVMELYDVLVLRENDLVLLDKQLSDAETRFDLGDATRTDVAQAKARKASAQAELAASEATLKAALSSYERLTGLEPDLAVAIDVDVTLNKTLDQVISIALSEHPNLQQAQFLSQMNSSEAREILGELLPELTLTGRVSRSYNPTFGDFSFADNSRLVLGVDIPLYLGGAARARYRQSRYAAEVGKYSERDVRRQIENDVVVAWENYQAAGARAKARELQVEAAALAFEGVDKENEYGARTILDVLDAEQELLQAKVDGVAARFDVIRSYYDVLRAMGQLRPERFDVKTNDLWLFEQQKKARKNWF